MKLFIALPILVIAILGCAVLALPVRFRLESSSPSGNSQVRGLRFQGQSAHALNDTLRLFVSHNQTDSRQQTIIPWGRDLAIKWNEVEPVDTFVVEKDGRDLVEFQIAGSVLTCTKGVEYLAKDPYEKNQQNTTADSRAIGAESPQPFSKK